MTKILLLLVGLLCGLTMFACASTHSPKPSFQNLAKPAEDKQKRASLGYMLHRAWVQITGQKSDENGIAQIQLNLEQLANEDSAIAWLGHDTLLIRMGDQWILTDPIFSEYATPFPPFGPKRLAGQAIALRNLPHIDVVLISHDHYDHLDLETVKVLAKQQNGSPQFLVGSGLKAWFNDNVPGAKVEEFQWWDELTIAHNGYQFVPAHHSSGRKFTNKNRSLWGGWVIKYKSKSAYFAGDSAYERELYQQLKQRLGHIDLAALPIGAYMPRDLMRFEHMNPEEAMQAHIDLQPKKSIAIHWGTFQLGDETSDEIRADFANALAIKEVDNFGLLAIGEMVKF